MRKFTLTEDDIFFKEKMNDYIVRNEDGFFFVYIPERLDRQEIETFLAEHAKKNGTTLLWFRESDEEAVTFNYERKRLFH
jgi:hypothetical protein